MFRVKFGVFDILRVDFEEFDIFRVELNKRGWVMSHVIYLELWVSYWVMLMCLGCYVCQEGWVFELSDMFRGVD